MIIAGRLRSSMPYLGNPQAPRGLYMGGPYYQLPVPYSYQPGFSYPPYRSVMTIQAEYLSLLFSLACKFPILGLTQY